MSHDITDLRSTIIPKSDQLNSEQLLAGSMTIRVTDVLVGSSDEQPIAVHYEGENGRPFKPCKTMRKVLIFAWGPDGREWIGRSMTLYNDPQVRFGGAEVGGIRISHMTDIDKDMKVSLTATKGKKALHVIKRMADGDASLVAAIKAAGDVDALKAAFKVAYRATKDEKRQAAFKAEYDRRMQELAPSGVLQEYVAKVNEAANSDDASVFMDEARGVLNPTELAELNKAFAARFGGDE